MEMFGENNDVEITEGCISGGEIVEGVDFENESCGFKEITLRKSVE